MLIIMERHKNFIFNSKVLGKLLVWRVYISKELPKFGFTSTLKKEFTKAKQLPKYTKNLLRTLQAILHKRKTFT